MRLLGVGHGRLLLVAIMRFQRRRPARRRPARPGRRRAETAAVCCRLCWSGRFRRAVFGVGPGVSRARAGSRRWLECHWRVRVGGVQV